MAAEKQPCGTCGMAMPAIRLSSDERVVTMRSCARCDQVWWTIDGEPADPTEVFAKR
jgi:hypothetical protein